MNNLLNKYPKFKEQFAAFTVLKTPFSDLRDVDESKILEIFEFIESRISQNKLDVSTWLMNTEIAFGVKDSEGYIVTLYLSKDKVQVFFWQGEGNAKFKVYSLDKKWNICLNDINNYIKNYYV